MSRKSVSAKKIRLEAPQTYRIHQAFALTQLELLDHAKTWMTFLRIDGGVGKIAAALVLSDEDGRLVHESVKLTHRVPRILGLDLSPDFVCFSPFVVQILNNSWSLE